MMLWMGELVGVLSKVDAGTVAEDVQSPALRNPTRIGHDRERLRSMSTEEALECGMHCIPEVRLLRRARTLLASCTNQVSRV